MELQTARIHARKCKPRVRSVCKLATRKPLDKKSTMREKEMGRNARKSERRGERRRTVRDGDGRARKHLQRIGLTRVFNPARGFLVGEIKRGQVKRDARKIARTTHTEQNRIAGIKGFSNMEDRMRDRKRRRNEREREKRAVFGEISSL